MTKEELKQKYVNNCALIGDIDMNVEKAEMAFQCDLIEIEKKKKALMVENKNLLVDMEKLKDEEAKAAIAVADAQNPATPVA